MLFYIDGKRIKIIKRLSGGVREKNHALHQQRWEDIKKISAKLSDQWRACGLGVKRLTPADFYRWMVRWFNPSSTTVRLKKKSSHGLLRIKDPSAGI